MSRCSAHHMLLVLLVTAGLLVSPAHFSPHRADASSGGAAACCHATAGGEVAAKDASADAPAPVPTNDESPLTGCASCCPQCAGWGKNISPHAACKPIPLPRPAAAAALVEQRPSTARPASDIFKPPRI